MRNKLFLTLCVMLINLSAFAQNSGVAADLGYTFNKTNLAYLGVSASSHAAVLSGPSSELFHIGVGAGVYGGSFNSKFKFIPAGYLNVGMDLINTKTIVSKYFINPTLELNVLNFAKLNVGYSIPFESLNGVKMKGITVGLTFSIGTTGYYLDPGS